MRDGSNLRATLERLEELIEIYRSGGAATATNLAALREEITQLDLLRGEVDPNTRARIEKLSALFASESAIGPPTITSIVVGGPAPLGDQDGFIPFLLNGTNFINVLSIVFNPGNVPATGIGQDTSSATQVSGFTPALVPGVYDVVVTTASGSFTLPAAFESWDADQIIAPTIAHVYDSEEGITEALGVISQWDDQGSLAANLTAAGAQQPLYVTQRFGDNLRHALLLDGVANELDAAGPISFGARTTFAVLKWDNNNLSSGGFLRTGEIICGPGIAPTDAGIHEYALDTTGGLATQRTFDADMAVNFRSPDDPATYAFSGGIVIVGITHNGGTGDLNFFVNNTAQGAPQNDPFNIARASWDRIGNGIGNAFKGEIGAIVQVEGIITAPDQAKLVAWMWGKWASRSYVATVVNQNTAWFARDGAGLLTLDGGATIFMLGGWNSQGPGQFPQFPENVTNEVWRTVDGGVTWVQILPDVTLPPDRWTPRHVPGAWLTHKGFMYVIGSDVYNGPQNNLGTGVGTQDVWRSTNGIDWELVTATAQWPVRTLHGCASFNGSLYLFGGQTDLNDPNTALNDVWRSDDDGVTWVQLPNAPWTGRGAWGSSFPIFQNKIWVMGGQKYDNAAILSVFYNDVWTFDGTTWTQVLADGVAPWAKRSYQQQLAFNGRLWIINGDGPVAPGTNIADMWTSTDGVTWIQQTITPWRTSHADGACVVTDGIVIGPGNGDIGQPGDPGVGHVYKITRLGFAHP